MAGAGLAAFLGTGACLSGAVIAGGISVSTVYAGSGIAINSEDKNLVNGKSVWRKPNKNTMAQIIAITIKCNNRL